MSTVILGWDGLDHRLSRDLGFSENFSPYNKEIETFDNEVLGRPESYEVWPTIITGKKPSEHGVKLISGKEGAQLSLPLGERLSGTLHKRLPEGVRLLAALALRNMGVGLDQKDPEWYKEQGLDTIFDGYKSRSIAIPNYRTEKDDQIGLESGWKYESEFLRVEPSISGLLYRPKIPEKRLEERLTGDVGRRIEILKSCVDRYDLVFLWIPFLDTIGHISPATDGYLQKRAYQYASSVTEKIRSTIDGDVIVISDHGHRNGDHTHSAFFGATQPDILENIESVADIKNAVRDIVEINKKEKKTES